MTIGTIARYLIGRRDAIVALALDRWAVPIGLLLVFSAALARKYDGYDLLHEPWVLFGSYVAAFVNSLLLYSTFWLVAGRHGALRPRFMAGYKSFLGLFLLTAPMAWLYGLPFERRMDPSDAVAANLWMLAFVSVWRVVLMTRVLSVLWQAPAWRVFFFVMLIADIEAMIGLAVMPNPMIAVMGGVEYAPGERVLAESIFFAQILSMLTLPMWLIGAIVSITGLRPRWALRRRMQVTTAAPTPVLAIVALSIVGWSAAAFLVQPEQRLRHQVESMMQRDEVEAALQMMSAHDRNDFPPIWNAPPRPSYHEYSPHLSSIANEMLRCRPARWVVEMYLPRIAEAARREFDVYFGPKVWTAVVERSLPLEEGRPRPPRETATLLRCIIELDDSLTENDRAALNQLLQSVERL